ncbi:hypothetical protein HaLaN_29579 [Haematococcus lacustris]|uniref:Uncharacterized protein n=1 Tax=Haematococcus lacustris TaxID=44745 RepID=A0A6A0ADB1_HAELA|nr:hypothetical protein HaLaN_29579 [Haematococcus lacustris]
MTSAEYFRKGLLTAASSRTASLAYRGRWAAPAALHIVTLGNKRGAWVKEFEAPALAVPCV